MRNLAGSVAVVTGGARGVGAAIAAELAGAGADIAIWDAPDWPAAPIGYPLSDVDEMGRSAERVRALGRRAHAVAVDMRSPEAVEAAAAQTLAALGSIDILVCAAGVRSATPVSRMTDEQWDSVIDTNLHGAYHAIRSTLAQLEASGSGRVLIVAAEEGRRGAPGLAHYAAAAWGQIGLAKSLALESAPFGVAVNVVTPGPIATQMSERRLLGHGAVRPLGRAVRRGGLGGRGAGIPGGGPSQRPRLRERRISLCRSDVRDLRGGPGDDRVRCRIDVSAGLAAMNTV